MNRGRGPLCSAELGPAWLDAGSLARTQAAPRAPQGAQAGEGLSPQEQALLLDLLQMTLDLVGIVDPTPAADGTNAVISIGRGDWWGAGLSGIATLPYLGDLAKAGRLGRWGNTAHQAVTLARLRPAFAAKAKPLLQQLARLMARVPDSLLPALVRDSFQALRRELFAFARPTLRLPRKQMLDAFLAAWLKDIDKLALPAPGLNRGALWSKLGAKAEGMAGFVKGGDDAALSGADLAQRLAAQDGRKTLEGLLGPSGFEAKLKADARALSELVGGHLAWAEFEQKVWSHVSLKYVKSLQGRVVVYVDDAVLRQALQKGDLPVLSAELQELLKRRRAGEGIMSVEARDIFDGTHFEL